MLRRTFVTLLLAIGASLIPASSFAQGTPDGQTPAEESECDVLSGAAFGICNAYCEATDCGDGVNYANFHACASLQKNWRKKTGLRDLPCDCEAGFVFVDGAGCECAVDLVVEILNLTPGACDDTSCDTIVDLQVSNLGIVDVATDIPVLVELSNGAQQVVILAGPLAAGTTQPLQATVSGATNCFDTACTGVATVDPRNVIEECDELNNTDTLEILG